MLSLMTDPKDLYVVYVFLSVQADWLVILWMCQGCVSGVCAATDVHSAVSMEMVQCASLFLSCTAP